MEEALFECVEKVYISLRIGSQTINKLKYVIETEAGPNLVKMGFLHPNWTLYL